MPWTVIDLPGADVALDADWMPRAEADVLMDALLAALPWSVHRIRMFGRLVDSPRLSCWIGDPGTSYAYSGIRFEPHPWPAMLVPVRARVAAACGAEFNSVLANLYRDGRDAMGWHRDNEPELGAAPVIGSLSLGATRRFLLKRVEEDTPMAGKPAAALGRHPAAAAPARPASTALALGTGSLLRMAGGAQREYRHALPRTRVDVGARINLTFRRIVA